MKHFIFTFLLTTFITTTTWAAADCIGGRPVSFNALNTHTFCVSNNSMTWWSGFSWCRANGREFATRESICNLSEDNTTRCDKVESAGLNNTEKVFTASPDTNDSSILLTRDNAYTPNYRISSVKRNTTNKVICY